MEASQELHLPNYMKDDNISQETNNLISSLPADKDFMGYSLYNYKGCWYYPNTLQAVLDVQEHFQPRKKDINLASLPKGGTIWLKSIVFSVLHRENTAKIPKHILCSHKTLMTLSHFLRLSYTLVAKLLISQSFLLL